MYNIFISNHRIKGLIIFTIGPFLFSILTGGHPITIDGQFDDWNEVPLAYEDPDGDGTGADFADLKITYDNHFLFLYLNFHSGEYLMQDWNSFYLYIDADNDLSTGYSISGIGAELVWFFGDRSGIQYINGQEVGISQNDLTLRIGPTITSNQFEVAFSRESDILTMNNSQTLLEGKIIIKEDSPSSDILPNESGGIYFNIGEDYILDPTPISFERNNESDIRIVSYNTLNGGMIEPERQPHFKRLMQAIDPDVIAIQEHWDWNEIDDVVQSWFPEETWHASWTYRDLVVLSRFPILNDANMISSERTMTALLDTEQELGTSLLIFNSHLSCCSANDDRQEQVDEFTSKWRDWIYEHDGPFAIDHGTPFIHLGDFNFVGYRQQVETLRIGDIDDENEYGEDYFPDWDESPIIDLFPRHTHKRMGYTWRNDWSSYNPGKLDYIFYSDATIEPGKHFIVNTLAMDQEALDYYGLNWNDTQEASDHLPIIFDISISTNVGIELKSIQPEKFILLNNYPNPFNPVTKISIKSISKALVNIQVLDIKGRNVETLFHGYLEDGFMKLEWNGVNHSSGVYFIKFKSKNSIYFRKIMLLK